MDILHSENNESNAFALKMVSSKCCGVCFGMGEQMSQKCLLCCCSEHGTVQTLIVINTDHVIEAHFQLVKENLMHG